MTMKTVISILVDIHRPDFSMPFYKQSSRLEYDAKSPTTKKLHMLTYQQGPHYGQVGDQCDYLTHDELLELERRNVVRIHRQARHPKG